MSRTHVFSRRPRSSRSCSRGIDECIPQSNDFTVVYFSLLLALLSLPSPRRSCLCVCLPALCSPCRLVSRSFLPSCLHVIAWELHHTSPYVHATCACDMCFCIVLGVVTGQHVGSRSVVRTENITFFILQLGRFALYCSYPSDPIICCHYDFS